MGVCAAPWAHTDSWRQKGTEASLPAGLHALATLPSAQLGADWNASERGHLSIGKPQVSSQF